MTKAETDRNVARLRDALAALPVAEARYWSYGELCIELEAGDFTVAKLAALGGALPGATIEVEYDFSGPCIGYGCSGGHSSLELTAKWPDGAPDWVRDADLSGAVERGA